MSISGGWVGSGAPPAYHRQIGTLTYEKNGNDVPGTQFGMPGAKRGESKVTRDGMHGAQARAFAQVRA